MTSIEDCDRAIRECDKHIRLLERELAIWRRKRRTAIARKTLKLRHQDPEWCAKFRKAREAARKNALPLTDEQRPVYRKLYDKFRHEGITGLAAREAALQAIADTKSWRVVAAGNGSSGAPGR